MPSHLFNRRPLAVGFLPLALGLLLFACKTGTRTDQPNTAVKDKTRTDMTLTPLPTPPPGSDYADEWRIVDSLQNQGLLKSALEKVETIEARARIDSKPAQVLKALIFRGKFITGLEEDGIVKAIELFEKNTAEAKQPERAVLQSLTAELYTTYLRNQGWRIRNRTEAPPSPPDGGETGTPNPTGEPKSGASSPPTGGPGGAWLLTASAAQIERRALDLYAASVEPLAPVLSAPAEGFRDILTPGLNDSISGKPLRPGLYDLLADRAIQHFRNERNYLTQPAYAFLLDQPEAFAPVADFLKIKFESQDLTSGKWLAVKAFQKVLSQYAATGAGQGNASASIAADLARLQFAQNTSSLDNKNALYARALEALHQQHRDHPMDGEIVWNMAHHLVYGTEATDKEKGANARSAVALLEDVLLRHPGTYGAQQCQVLLREIQAASMQTEIEKVGLPGRSLLVSLGFANLKAAYVRVVRISSDPADWEKIRRSDPEFNEQKWLKSQKPVQTRTWRITDPGDYQQHRTEIALEPLPVGSYWLLVSGNADFDAPDTHPEAFTAFTVSNLASVSYSQQGKTSFVAMDRTTGAPLAGVKFDFYHQDYRSGREERRFVGSATSGTDGFAAANIPENMVYDARASLGNDTLWAGQASNYDHRDNYQPQPQAQFFTDRSIYRPGQTVYFKAVAYQLVKTDGKQLPQILANQKVTARFYDTNGQPKATLELRSNEFGTFNGAFAAPASGLTGGMSIRCDELQGQADFSVEEYKRPKFEVTTKPIEGAFRVNDKITLRGEAKNYAGSAVGDAQVRYRVTRQARYPMWDWGWMRRPNYSVSEQEITSGIATTDANGAFSVEFQALPDPAVAKKDQPIFDYQVSVDVTDITGETRSATATVSAGYAALQMAWVLPNDADLDSLSKTLIVATNMAGQPQSVVGEITLQRLVAPKSLYISRYWEKPDLATIPKSDFTRLFPDYAFMDEDDPMKWGREDFTRSVPFNTATSKTADLNGGRIQPGYYLVKLTTKDSYGEAVTLEKVVRVFDSKKPATRFTTPDNFVEKNTLEPGQTARIWMGSQAPLMHVLLARHQSVGAEKPRWLPVRGAEKVEIPVTEADRGGIVLHGVTVLNNRIYGPGQIRVEVPWSNKDLSISYETFRDKLAPGQREEWRIKISGPKKDRVAAEMVAAMYDASLDQFQPHEWRRIGFPLNAPSDRFGTNWDFQAEQGYGQVFQEQDMLMPSRNYRQINWFDFPFWGGGVVYAMKTMARSNAPEQAGEEMLQMSDMAVVDALASAAGGMAPPKAKYEDIASTFDPEAGEVHIVKNKLVPPPPAPIRRNLNETVFFFPELRTDAEGNVVLKFTMNEALTRWKLLTYAHTKDLQQALSVKEVVTQKELMVIANAPRFLRAGDEFEFAAKVSNLSQEAINGGTATLSLLDANTLQPVEKDFGLTAITRVNNFNIPAGQSAPLAWRVRIPADFAGAVTWQISADGKKFRDGEESTLPVVTNRMLVTETLPISVRGGQTKTFVFDNLKNAPTGNNSSLITHNYTLEFSSNPAWYAVQSLPYLMEFPHECAEQMFSRFYANTLAASVVEKMPNIKRIYERWKTANGGAALKSNLSKNQELKSALLEETPWVMDAQNEEQQKQNIALLFDLNRMSDERERVLGVLTERQNGDGSWSWFPGGPGNWHITQHIVSGFGHLAKLGALDAQKDQRTAEMLEKALDYCETKMNEQYRELEKQVQAGKAKFEDDHLDGMVIQYLYARSFFIAPVDKPSRPLAYYLDQSEKYWLSKGLYQEGMLSLALHRAGRAEAAQRIVASLRERATMKEELGMYWPTDWGFYWYQLPVETQALMVEVFGEVANDQKSVEELRIWLLKNKQTNRWESTKATAEAVYALLLGSDFKSSPADSKSSPANWLNNTKPVQISMGGKALKISEYEPGTGYFKQNWPGKEVKPSWAEIKVENPNSNIAWGAAYWQYFEDLDKIKDFKKTPLTIVKQLFLEENTPTGPVLKPIAEGQKLKRGDRVKVRIEIRVDRAMEYVHLKDMRAAGFEPINVLSQYKWQDGLGYYESTKDLATHFFIDYLPRGTFVFEYPMVVSHRGDMSNGVTTMQCMYAPEFASHSKGVRIKVE